MSFFSPWKTYAEDTTASTSNNTTSSSSNKLDKTQEFEGPITAPGGWSNLLTWRPQKPITAMSPSSSSETFIDADTSIAGPSHLRVTGNDDQLRGSPKMRTNRSKYNLDECENEDHENEPEMRLFTARTRQKGGGVGTLRPRAPIPFELDRSVFTRSKARSGTMSSIGSSNDSRDVSSITSWPLIRSPEENGDAKDGDANDGKSGLLGITPHSSQFKSTDSADVSAELISSMASSALECEEIGADLSNFDGALADMSLESGALDSAFETLTRIKAKDVAAKTVASSRSNPSSSTSQSNVSSRTRIPSSPLAQRDSNLGNKHTSRKPSFGSYYTPNESPTQPSGTWMQWGTSKIKATMPRGLASALFAVMGDQAMNGDVSEAQTKGSKSVDEEGRVEDLSDDDTEQDDYGKVLVEDCIDVICDDTTGLLTLEGLFRISPSNMLLKSTKKAYVQGNRPNLSKLTEQDRHLPAALLKDYLRALQPPVFPSSTYDAILACPKDESEAIQYIRSTLAPLIRSDRLTLLQEILRCVHEVSKHSDQNRMDPTNLAVVLTPNLLHGEDVLQDVALCGVGKNGSSPILEEASGKDKNEGMTLGEIVRLCIERYEELFEE